jgi:phytoene synthase
MVRALSIPGSLFDNKLYGIWMDIQYQGYETETDFAVYQQYAASSVGALHAYVVGFKNPASLGWAEAVMQPLHRIELLQNMGKHVREGRVYMPKTLLAAYGVSENELISLKTSPAFVALCTHVGQEARTSLTALLSTLPSEDWVTFRPFRRQIALSLALLDILERDHFPILNQRDMLTPFKRSWIILKTC